MLISKSFLGKKPLLPVKRDVTCEKKFEWDERSHSGELGGTCSSQKEQTFRRVWCRYFLGHSLARWQVTWNKVSWMEVWGEIKKVKIKKDAKRHIILALQAWCLCCVWWEIIGELMHGSHMIADLFIHFGW